jgi:hypothetical protein
MANSTNGQMYVCPGFIEQLRPLQTSIFKCLSYVILAIFIHKNLLGLQSLQMYQVVQPYVVKKLFSTSNSDQ